MSTQSSTPVVPPHYAALGVAPSITQKELERSYRKLSLQLHPDRVAYRNDPAQEPQVRDRYQAITQAYTVLSDPQKRAAYDIQFGVNFCSRIEGLTRAIDSHNAEARLRYATKRPRGEDTPDAVPTGVNPPPTGASPTPDPHPVEGDDDDEDEDDEEYAPQASPLPSTRPHIAAPVPRGLRLTATKRRTTERRALGTDYAATVCRPFGEAPLWGLTVEGHTLTHVTHHPGLPFPALIRAVNDCRVQCESVIADVVRATTAPEPVLVDSGESGDGSQTPQSVLALALVYARDVYDLVGDLPALTEVPALDQLVPATQVTAELQGLLPGRAVLMVNEYPVRNAAELRAALKRAAEDCMATGRFARGISLQCASTDGLAG